MIAADCCAPRTVPSVLTCSRHPPPHPDIGIVFQSPVLWNARTAAQGTNVQAEAKKPNARRQKPSARSDLAGAVGLSASKTNTHMKNFRGNAPAEFRVSPSAHPIPNSSYEDEPFGAARSLHSQPMVLDLQQI